MKKVKDTLVISKSNSKEGGNSKRAKQSIKGEKRLAKPKENRKKVILRKKKPNRFGQESREGRQLEGSRLKTVKIRVRRLHEEPDFPVVY